MAHGKTFHRRSGPRQTALALLLAGASAFLANCDDATSRGCLACGLVGRATYETEREAAHVREECGACPTGEACNALYEPPRCAPAPGTEGTPCGFRHWAHRCADGYVCASGACTPMPGVGEPCTFGPRAPGDEQGYSGRGYCGPGLLCGPDDRCRPGCAERCSPFQVCSPFEAPPRCVASVALPGQRCGRLHRMAAIECVPLHVCVDRGAGGVCETSAPEGELCGSAERCPPGFSCDRSSSTCR